MVFKPGSPKEPYTAGATKFMDDNVGTIFRASPAEGHAMNQAEPRMGPLMAVTFSQIAYAKLCARFWGRSILHAADILNVRPKISGSGPHLKMGTCSYALWHGEPPDYSMYIVWGAAANAKIYGSKSNQLRRLGRDALLMGVSHHTVGWILMVIEDQSMISTWHANFDTNMDHRSSLIYRDGLAMNQDEKGTTSGISGGAADFNAKIRSLYRELPDGITEGVVVFSRLTRQPIHMVPAYDPNGDLTMSTEHALPAPLPDGDKKGDTIATPGTPATTPASAPPSTTPPPAGPINPMPTAAQKNQSIKDRIKGLADDVKITFVQPCPKRPGASADRYNKYMGCKTLGELRQMIGDGIARKNDLWWDYERAFFTFDDPTTLAFIGSPWGNLLEPVSSAFALIAPGPDAALETSAANANLIASAGLAWPLPAPELLPAPG